MSYGDDDKARAKRAQRNRNIALGLGLGFLAVLFYVMTFVRLGQQ
jgi:hypothetical protein